ncbi:hypothetical protein MBLNU230_g3556t1 [Neophaeotheca triangularis]
MASSSTTSSTSHDATASALLKASTPPSKAFFATLITANHILHHQNVLDAYGHISVRNPQNQATFFISKSLAPALVSSRDDIEEYYIEDATPVNEDAPKGYLERFIHSELYKKYKDVNSVIHSHSEAVIPFGITSVPLKPVYHMGSVLGPQAPVFDISHHYPTASTTSQPHNLLITSAPLGAALATAFNPSTTFAKTTAYLKNYFTTPSNTNSPSNPPFPPNPVVLMRGHGFTTLGTSVEESVYRAVYTCANARVQVTAMMLQGGFNVGLVAGRFGEGEKAGAARQEGVRFLAEREVRDAWEGLRGTVGRAWEGWVEAVEGEGYGNELRKGVGEGGEEEEG